MSRQILAKIETDNLHEIPNVICNVDGQYYQSFFYYDDNTPVKKREDVDRVFQRVEIGSIETNGKIIQGLLLHNNVPLPSDQLNYDSVVKFIKGKQIDSLNDFSNACWKGKTKLENIKLLKQMGSRFGSIFISQRLISGLHKTTGYVNLDGKLYLAQMFYKDDTKPVVPHNVETLIFDKYLSCFLHRSDEQIKVICLIDSHEFSDPEDAKVPLDVLFFNNEKKEKRERAPPDFLSDEKLNKVLEFASSDYPDHPLPKYVNKNHKIDLNLFDFGSMIHPGFTLSENDEHLKPIYVILQHIIDFETKSRISEAPVTSGDSGDSSVVENSVATEPTKSNVDMTDMITFWKEYAFKRMDEIMELARTNPFDKDSISSSPYLSIAILKKWNNFKFNWNLVTNNKGITDRDILANPDFQWDNYVLYSERILPAGFYKYKGIRVPEDYYCDEMNLPFEWTEMEILLSPEEPRVYTNKLIASLREKDRDGEEEFPDEVPVEESDINDAITLIMSEYPDYFQDSAPTFLEGIRKVVIEMIESNGLFILDDFVFPEDEGVKKSYDDIISKIKTILPEPTEDDPYSVRDIVEKLKEGDTFCSGSNIYSKRIGFPSYSKIYVKNRKEYVEYLQSVKKDERSTEVQNCVFFELEDPINYPGAFYLDHMQTMVSSGKLTLDYILSHPDLKWRASQLVKCLPIDYCIENLLFYPGRLRLSFLESNKFSGDLSAEEIHEELLKQDKEVMLEFSTRLGENHDLMFQYPDLNWTTKHLFSSDLPPQIKATMKKTDDLGLSLWRDKNNYSFENSVEFLSWKYFISLEGATMLVDYIGKRVDLTDFESKTEWDREMIVTNIIKTNKDLLQLLSDTIPSTMIVKNNKTKWIAPQNVNISKLIESYHGNDLLMLIIFISETILPYRYGNLINDIFKMINLLICKITEWRLNNTDEDRSLIYESFVGSIFAFKKILEVFNTGVFSILDRYVQDIIDTGSKFTLSDIGRSKYSWIIDYFNTRDEDENN